MKKMDNHSVSRSRRALLLRLSALGLLGQAGISGLLREAFAKSAVTTTSRLHSLDGTAKVNGVQAVSGTILKPGDHVSTGANSKAILVMGGDAFLLRDQTDVEFMARSDLLDTVNIIKGKILSVFAKRRDSERLQVRIPVGSIGVRGTGMYIECVEKRTYFCLCYGEAAIEGKNMKTTLVRTTHHESPLWLSDDGESMKVEAGSFLNHSDDELTMLEALFGREPAFAGLPSLQRY